MFSSFVGTWGFRTAFKITLEKRLTTPLGTTTLPLPTLPPLTRMFFEIDATVRMNATGTGNTFELVIFGLGPTMYSLLNPGETLLHIALGYHEGGTQDVMTGLLREKSLKAGDGLYEAHLSGVDAVFDALQNVGAPVRDTFSGTPGTIARALCAKSHVDCTAPSGGASVTGLAYGDVTPRAALWDLARRNGWTLQAKDGKLWIGDPTTLGVPTLEPITDGATSRPVTTAGTTSALDGHDFDVPGRGDLRPNNVVTFGTDTYRIESVRHRFTRDGGYRCIGRALPPSATHAESQAAGGSTAARVAGALADHLNERERTRSPINVAEVGDYNVTQHAATLNAGHDATPEMVTPTTQAPLRTEHTTLPDRPMASPFAFDNCGLMVPVYPGMRALVVNRFHDPNDAVVDGFVWTDPDMPKPHNQSGDWWLCLPTELGADGKPSGKGVDDLTDAGGKRVIALKGLKITVGDGLLNPVGTRPQTGADGACTIETADGAKITVSGSSITLTDGSVTLTVGNGKVSVGSS